jgi:small subunit ribosomal protein S4
MPKRKHKKFNRPKRPFDKKRIEEERKIINKYGLKNKKEIWKAETEVDKIRNQAKKLLTKTSEEQNKFIERMKKKGFKVETIAEVLSLEKQDYLNRRLQTIIHNKKIANTPKQARQFIVHKHIKIQDNVVNIPSYMVPVDEEEKISLKLNKKIQNKENE